MDSETVKQINIALNSIALSLIGLSIHGLPSMGERNTIFLWIWLALGLAGVGRIFLLVRKLSVTDKSDR